MSKVRPKISEEASPQAKRVHAFLIERDLSVRGWAKQAGISPSLLTELFSGRTRGLAYEKLRDLGRVVGVSPEEIAGDSAPSDEVVSKTDVYRAVFAWAVAEGQRDPASAAAAVVSFLNVDGGVSNTRASGLLDQIR